MLWWLGPREKVVQTTRMSHIVAVRCRGTTAGGCMQNFFLAACWCWSRSSHALQCAAVPTVGVPTAYALLSYLIPLCRASRCVAQRRPTPTYAVRSALFAVGRPTIIYNSHPLEPFSSFFLHQLTSLYTLTHTLQTLYRVPLSLHILQNAVHYPCSFGPRPRLFRCRRSPRPEACRRPGPSHLLLPGTFSSHLIHPHP